MPQYIILGSLKIYLYGIFVIIATFTWLWYLKKYSPEFNFNFFQNEKFLFWLMIFVLIGARAYHVLSWISYYRLFPLEMLFVWQGGLGIFGAIGGGLLAIIIFSFFKKTRLLNLLNLFFPPLLLAQAIGRSGNFFNHECFGPPTNLPWKIYIPPANRPIIYAQTSYFHPTFLYESIFCLLAFLFYLYLVRKTKKKSFGFSYYLISYGIIRLFSESLRFDTWEIFSIRVGQLLALIMILAGLVIQFYTPKYVGRSGRDR